MFAGLVWTVLRGLPRSCRLCRRVGGVLLERPQPRSGEDERAGCRRAVTHHRERGGSFRAVVRKGVGVPGFAAGGVVSQAPIRCPAVLRADTMTMCPGTGLLSQMIERGLV